MRTQLNIAKANTIRLLQAATLGLALAFTLSCTSGGNGDDDGGGGGGGSGGSVPTSDKGNSISSYRTKRIGNQVWMAENLNYKVAGSKCYGEGGQVIVGWKDDGKEPILGTLSNAEIQSNCNKYGRLYEWATAMALPSSCNSTSCSSQVGVKHRGICPSGWHIPSDEEWGALMQYVNPDCSLTGLCSGAGTKLKATSGWNDYNGSSGNGTDEFGFSALPGGSGNSSGHFIGVGYYGNWWSATEYDASSAWRRRMRYRKADVNGYYEDKTYLFSVRCVQDNSETGVSSSSVPVQSGIIYGTPVTYEGETYNTVVIGTQTWMARNLNYAVEGSKCGDGNDGLSNNNTSTCDTYGRLYNWATAMALPSSCNSSSCSSQVGAKHRGICPSGWHIPSDAEWITLTRFVGGSSTAGTKLKATSGWNDYNGSSGNGTDEFGFSALPGGGGYSDGYFTNVGGGGTWWSATEYTASRAYDRHMYDYDADVLRGYYDKARLFSVRCVRDNSETGVPSSSKPSSSSTSSSSSSLPSSSSIVNDISNYRTVRIGDQVWMAENLNYDVSGSKCYGNDPANCAKYGKLYDWATAMALTPNCNSTSCSSQVLPKHRGICPSGWHIPSDEEWTTLTDYVGGEDTAGTKLKATSGWNWNDDDDISGNGTDEFGFSALPGGLGFADGRFSFVGDYGSWWSATEDSASDAYYRGMNCLNAYVGRLNGKTCLYSVRCVRD